MTTFNHFLDLLRTVPAPRRAQGRMYTLPHVLLFAILAVVAAPTRTGASIPSSTFTSTG